MPPINMKLLLYVYNKRSIVRYSLCLNKIIKTRNLSSSSFKAFFDRFEVVLLVSNQYWLCPYFVALVVMEVMNYMYHVPV